MTDFEIFDLVQKKLGNVALTRSQTVCAEGNVGYDNSMLGSDVHTMVYCVCGNQKLPDLHPNLSGDMRATTISIGGFSASLTSPLQLRDMDKTKRLYTMQLYYTTVSGLIYQALGGSLDLRAFERLFVAFRNKECKKYILKYFMDLLEGGRGTILTPQGCPVELSQAVVSLSKDKNVAAASLGKADEMRIKYGAGYVIYGPSGRRYYITYRK